MKILAIDTSCDETAVAVTSGRKILSNEIYSQILIHKKWGGVVPNLAKRAHEERIDLVVEGALQKASLRLLRPPAFGGTPRNDIWRYIDYIAVTVGPGLAPALEVGIRKAKELARKYRKKIIPINHMEGHIYSCFAQNSRGNPKREFTCPYLALLVSGGHTELVLIKDHGSYEILGETLDDAAGEALDKIAKLMGLGYPGGSVIERLAETGDINYHRFPRPMSRSNNLNFSFSGLKTSFYYFFKKMDETDRSAHINDLAASFQEAVFDSLIKKLDKALQKVSTNGILLAGGVAANKLLRKKVSDLARKKGKKALFPTFKTLYGDNAAMIGIAASLRAKNYSVSNFDNLERVPRLRLTDPNF